MRIDGQSTGPHDWRDANPPHTAGPDWTWGDVRAGARMDKAEPYPIKTYRHECRYGRRGRPLHGAGSKGGVG